MNHTQIHQIEHQAPRHTNVHVCIRTERGTATGTATCYSILSWLSSLFYSIPFYFIFGMPAYIVCTDYFDNTVIDTHGDFTQKLQYRAQCVKERSYSTAPLVLNRTEHLYSILHTIYTHQHSQKERERERERERESKRGMRREERKRTPIQ